MINLIASLRFFVVFQTNTQSKLQCKELNREKWEYIIINIFDGSSTYYWGVVRTLSNIYDGAFSRKSLTAFVHGLLEI